MSAVPAGAVFDVEVAVDIGERPLGAYTLAIDYPADVVIIRSVSGGNADEFSSPPLVNPAEFASGRARLSAFNLASVTSPTGVVSVARVRFEVVRALRPAASLAIEVISLVDTSGANVAATTIPCRVLIEGFPTATLTPSATPAPPTPTSTPTATLSCPAPCTVTGRIFYFGSGRPVPGVQLELAGPQRIPMSTDSGGKYGAGPLVAGRWTIPPWKAGVSGGAVTALDAAHILQFIVGKRAFGSHRMLACDVTGNGACTALDAAHVLQFVVGKGTRFHAGQLCDSDWVFVPVPTAVAGQSVIQPRIQAGTCQRGQIVADLAAGPAEGADFVGILLGDVIGNWQ